MPWRPLAWLDLQRPRRGDMAGRVQPTLCRQAVFILPDNDDPGRKHART